MNLSRDAEDLILTAYYPRVIETPTALRGRAQAAFSIASTLAGGLLGVALLTNVATASTLAKITSLGALIAWFLAALLFVRSIVGSATPGPGAGGMDRATLVREILDDIEEERANIERRIHVATAASAIAAVLTIAFVVILFAVPANRVQVLLTLDSSYRAELTRVCKNVAPLSAALRQSDLKNAFVVAAVEQSNCSNITELMIPTSKILLVEVP